MTCNNRTVFIPLGLVKFYRGHNKKFPKEGLAVLFERRTMSPHMLIKVNEPRLHKGHILSYKGHSGTILNELGCKFVEQVNGKWPRTTSHEKILRLK